MTFCLGPQGLPGPKVVRGFLNSQGSQMGGGQHAPCSLIPKQQARDPLLPGINPEDVKVDTRSFSGIYLHLCLLVSPRALSSLLRVEDLI